MALYDKAGAAPPQAADILLDTVYTAPAPGDVACFLQDGDERLDFIRPVVPLDGATDVSNHEDVVAHLIGDYGSFSTVSITMNGEALQRSVAASVDGILVSRITAERDLEADVDDLVHIVASGTEAVAGAQSESWSFAIRGRPQLVAPVAAVVPVRALLLGPVAAFVQLRQPTFGLAAAAVRHRLTDQLIGRAAGRIFVGDFFLWFDSGPTVNVAEIFKNDQFSVTVEVEGFATFFDGSAVVEIRGAQLSFQAGPTVNVTKAFLTFDSGVTVELGVLDQKTANSLVVELWGEASANPAGRLVIRTSSLSPALKAALENHGIRFNP